MSHPAGLRTKLLIAIALVLCGAALFWAFRPHKAPMVANQLLLAPMMALDRCLDEPGGPIADERTEQELRQACDGPEGSAAALVESTLSQLKAPEATSSYELGYTLNVPLLTLFKQSEGDWVIDREKLAKYVRTLRDVERPVILYLFSTHFHVNAAIEEALAADPLNLSWTKAGPLGKSQYYSAPIYNWSFASSRTSLTARRVQAANAVLEELCRLDPHHVRKIRGITLLGETHHLFPNFESDMGFKLPYLITDYSPTSRDGFRVLLRKLFGTLERLNEEVGGSWKSFDEIEPPSKDIRTEPLKDFTEHIDAYAHGKFPVTGWMHVKGATDAAPAWVRVYLNGELAGRTPINLSRQDVLEALPELGTANTGWRLDVDFRSLRKGVHRIDVLLEDGRRDPILLGTRKVAIMDKSQSTPEPLPAKDLPAHRQRPADLKGHLDLPADQSSYFYNPFVVYWHAFRALQVRGYIEDFNRAVTAPCFAGTKRFTHQIIPFSNPGWDETKFAIDASLTKLPGIDLGISLYGEPTYGVSFTDWLAKTAHTNYGITEFHPLKPMDAEELDKVLMMHARKNAEFVSFFMEPRWKGKHVARGNNLFSLDPLSTRFGGAKLFESMQEVASGR